MVAQFYETLKDKTVRCLACPHECVLREGKTGICKVRKNKEGELLALTYRKYAAVSFDPIEKKPLYHFYPGKEILSIGSVGCNMNCKWCQNSEISQVGPGGNVRLTGFSPDDLLRIATSRNDNIGIAFTYNEPSINVESNLEIAKLFKANDQNTVMVTNGYFSKTVLNEYLKVIDAFNVDIKAFNEKIYKRYTSASLTPVLENIATIKRNNKHLELTYLIVPQVNDDYKEFSSFCSWISKNIGDDSILHISRYFPRYKMMEEPTSGEILKDFAYIAADCLKYVYVGNIPLQGFIHTKCPDCQVDIINRYGYLTRINKQAKDGKCPYCRRKIFIS